MSREVADQYLSDLHVALEALPDDWRWNGLEAFLVQGQIGAVRLALHDLGDELVPTPLVTSNPALD